MSREIKFRAWVKPLKRYANGIDTILYHKACDVEGGGIWSVVCEEWDSEVYEYDNIVIEQYTDLKDKNGKEIYEGDIVEWVNGLGEKHIFEIMWNECRASFQMVEIGQEYPYILQGLSDKMKPYCEVIGNIHENPELLGGEK